MINYLEKMFEENLLNVVFNESNHVDNIINYFKETITIKEKEKELGTYEHDSFRMKYCCNAYNYTLRKKENGASYTEDEALLGDSMFPFWTPYQMLLFHYAKWCAFKTKPSLEALINTFYAGNIWRVNRMFNDFAKMCYTKGNFIQNPKRGMYHLRHNLAGGGMDEVLNECFSGGKLSKFFDDDEKVKDWITEQKLNMFFKNEGRERNDLTKENIIPMIAPSQFVRFNMSKGQMKEYLEKAIEIINKRNEILP